MYLLSWFNPLLANDWLFLFVPLYLVFSFIYFAGDLSIRVHRWFFTVLAVLLFARAGLRIFFQYLVWNAGPPGIYFLPPHQPLSYFFQYSFTHHLASLLFTLLAIGGVVLVFEFFRWLKETPERRLWREGEEYIFLSGALLVRWPLVIPYIFLGVAVAFGYFVFARYALRQEFVVLNIIPFFAGLVFPILYFQEYIFDFFLLNSLRMPL